MNIIMINGSPRPDGLTAAMLHRLAEPYREIFSLRIFAELSFKEIGAVFGRTENWARVTFFRAKKLLIAMLEQEGVTARDSALTRQNPPLKHISKTAMPAGYSVRQNRRPSRRSRNASPMRQRYSKRSGGH